MVAGRGRWPHWMVPLQLRGDCRMKLCGLQRAERSVIYLPSVFLIYIFS